MSEHWWSGHDDSELSEVDLAEKRWALAIEERDRFNREVTARIDNAVRCSDSHERIEQIMKEMQALDENVRALHRDWCAKKPYLPMKLKETLGCDPAVCVPFHQPTEEECEAHYVEDARKTLKKKEAEFDRLQKELAALRQDLADRT